MGKNILLINGSPRKKNTWGMLSNLSETLISEGHNTEMIHIRDYEIKECLGCEKCVKGCMCPIQDDVAVLRQKMIESDGIILGTPVYMCQLSATLKKFIDRTPDWFHRPELVGKPAFAVVTTAGSYHKYTAGYLEKVFNHWGTLYSGSALRKVTQLSEDVQVSELQQFLDLLTSDSDHYKPTLNNLILFQVQKVLAQKVMPVDLAFWEKQGWVNADFFCKVKIPFFRKKFARAFHRMLYKKINPDRDYSK